MRSIRHPPHATEGGVGFQVKAIQPTETKKSGFIFFNSLSTSIHSSPIHDGAQSRTSTRICEDKHTHALSFTEFG